MKTDCLSLAVGNQIVAQDVEKMRQTQLSVDERMAALLRVVDTDVESSGKHIDKCRQIDPCTVDAAYGSGELQSRSELHDIRRRELLGEEQRRLRDFDRHRIGDGRIAKPGENQTDLEIRQQKRRFEQRRLRRFLLKQSALATASGGIGGGQVRAAGQGAIYRIEP